MGSVRVSAMASSGSGSQLPTPAIGDKPHQPSFFHFPQREFGKTSVVKRSFQRQWFDRWSWLHYDEDRDLAFSSVLRVSLLTRIITCSLLIAWSRHLFLVAFLTGKTLLPSLRSTKVVGVTKILC